MTKKCATMRSRKYVIGEAAPKNGKTKGYFPKEITYWLAAAPWRPSRHSFR